jgi:RNA polymerase sigma-70 factor (ECF subfamily)
MDTSSDPRIVAERNQALARGVRILIEKLTPTECAAYILREAFDYPYRDIAPVLRISEVNARQVVTRARQHMLTGRTATAISTELERLFGAFVTAAHDGDVSGLEAYFAATVVARSDELVRAA